MLRELAEAQRSYNLAGGGRGDRLPFYFGSRSASATDLNIEIKHYLNAK